MTVCSSPSAPATGWDRLQGLLDDFRAEQNQTEQFLAEMLDHLTQAVSASIEEGPAGPSAVTDPRVDQLIATAEQHRAAVDEACRLAELQAERFAQAAAQAERREVDLVHALEQDRDSLRAAEVAAQLQVEQLTDTIRQGLDELLELARQRTAAERALEESILRTIREERTAAAQAAAEAVDAAVSGAMEKVISHALEKQATLVANSLAEHRSMMAVAAEAMRRAADGVAEERNEAPRTGTEASPLAGAARESRVAPATDAVLDSIRAQFEILQRQTVRRRQAKPESRS